MESEKTRLILVEGVGITVDADMFQQISQHKWRFNRSKRDGGKLYAVCSIWKDGKTKHVLMHREIAGAKPGQIIDHIDGNTLNNLRANLRAVSSQQNAWNSNPKKRKKGKTSKFKGPYLTKTGWACAIYVNGKTRYLGRFASEIEAAKAYDAAAIKYFGKFARLNSPCLSPKS